MTTPKDGVDVPVPPSGEAEYQSWLPVGKHAPEKVYYMRDNHTFRALPLDVKAACEAIREEFADGESYGMLCTKRPGAAAPLHAGKELAEFLPRAREWLVAEFAARGVKACPKGGDHELVSARNEAIQSGLICTKCQGLFPEPGGVKPTFQTQPEKPE